LAHSLRNNAVGNYLNQTLVNSKLIPPALLALHSQESMRDTLHEIRDTNLIDGNCGFG
jgi:hypothetical protein